MIRGFVESEQSESMKYLGVVLADKLRCSTHLKSCGIKTAT